MKNFEYAAPRSEGEVLELLAPHWGPTEILAGGTDLIGLMKKMIVTPERVVNIKETPTLRGIRATSQGLAIGAAVTLQELLDSPHVADYPAIRAVLENVSSIQIRSQGTIGGELCQRPQCWYFRNGRGLLADRGRLVVGGDSRYHAILGNAGPAKFVHASRLAPALIALGAEVRIAGPGEEDEQIVPLADFFRTPRDENQREHVLQPNQLLTHVYLPAVATGWSNASYEVRHGEGPDYPLTAAAAALRIEGGQIRDARIVLGHVAPTPWIAREAETLLKGRPADEASAALAGKAAVAAANPLPDNNYKVQLAQVAVKRAILLAAGLETGGLS